VLVGRAPTRPRRQAAGAPATLLPRAAVGGGTTRPAQERLALPATALLAAGTGGRGALALLLAVADGAGWAGDACRTAAATRPGGRPRLTEAGGAGAFVFAAAVGKADLGAEGGIALAFPTDAATFRGKDADAALHAPRATGELLVPRLADGVLIAAAGTQRDTVDLPPAVVGHQAALAGAGGRVAGAAAEPRRVPAPAELPLR